MAREVAESRSSSMARLSSRVALVLGSFDSANRKELAPEYHSYVGKRPKWMKASI